MNREASNTVNYYGYKSINEMISAECSPLLDVLLKLSSASANFSSAANNVKNVSISDKNEIKELLDLVFDIREISSKVEKVIEQRIDLHLKVINSGVFEAQMVEKIKEETISEAIGIGKTINKGL